MITISLCMIVKNEEETLKRCLNSAKSVADEIIIVDTGSLDSTKAIAAEFTDKIYDFEWIEDFAAARNFSFEKATMDYIMWLDADDVIMPEEAAKLCELKKSLPAEVGAVMMRYNTGFDRQGEVTFSFFRERLTKRSNGSKWREPVHEHLETWGKRINADIAIHHLKPPGRTGDENRNIRIYESQLSQGKQLSARGMYYYARELKDHQRYSEAIRWFTTFLDSGQGWLEDNITASGELATCYLEQGQPQKAFLALLNSFYYDTPRAEICCQLGYFFKNQGKYANAAFWFKLILSLKKNEQNWGFCREDCWGYIPCLELAVCYDMLGEVEKAAKYNEAAAIFKPLSPAVAHNKKYFADKLANVDL